MPIWIPRLGATKSAARRGLSVIASLASAACLISSLAPSLHAQSGQALIEPRPDDLSSYFSQQNASDDPMIDLDGKTVVIRAAEAVLFGAYRYSDQGAIVYGTVHRILEARDGDRHVEFTFGREIPWSSAWIAVDLQSGRVAATSGSPRRAREVLPPSHNIRRGPSEKLDQLVHQRSRATLLLVRPKVGAWSIALGDGGEKDHDLEANGELVATLASLVPIGNSSSAPPEEIQPGDVLAMIDLETLEFYVVGLT